MCSVLLTLLGDSISTTAFVLAVLVSFIKGCKQGCVFI